MENDQLETTNTEDQKFIPVGDKWYDALLKKIPAGWKPDAKLFMYIGFGLLLFFGLIASTSTKKAPQATPTPQTNAPPTLPPNIYEENPVSQKTFISTKYRFSFNHLGLSDKCCFIVGPTYGEAEAIGNLSDPASVRKGSTSPFNGLSLYVIDLGNINPNIYMKKEANNLTEQYKQQYGEEPQNSSWQTLEVNGQPTILLKNYNSLTVNRYYVKFPNENKLLYIGASEEKLGSFNQSLGVILNSLVFEEATSSALPSPQL